MRSFRFLICFLPALLLLFFFIKVPVVGALTESEIAVQEAKLQAEYDALQQDIARWQGILDETKKKSNSLEGDITILNAKIKEAEATIKAKNIAIGQLSSDITSRARTIEDLETRIEKSRDSLAQILRKTNELDAYSLPEIILTGEDLSDFLSDLDTFTSIKRSLKEYFFEIREVKVATEEEKKQLDQRKNQEIDAKYVVETRKQTIAKSETEKKQLLTISKQEEKTYQTVLAERQRKAAQIRAALFSLRDTDGIPFGEALQYATVAGQKAGVRPALILAILTQESDLGKNQGSCLMTDSSTGDGVGKNTGTVFERVMKAPRDTVPFLAITSRLGRDWRSTPVSCPPGYVWSPSRGYGGAMGPSQFIASTWELFKERIAGAFNIKTDDANPWNPQHAIMATAIYLSDLGAGSGGYTAEIRAACKYYGSGGSDCSYGKQVMSKVQGIQDNIDFLQSV
jgi:membrane-bound lytic murein transglycosylase B